MAADRVRLEPELDKAFLEDAPRIFVNHAEVRGIDDHVQVMFAFINQFRVETDGETAKVASEPLFIASMTVPLAKALIKAIEGVLVNVDGSLEPAETGGGS